MGNDFYYLPQLLLTNGLERFMKCYICLTYEAKTGNYPSNSDLKNLGHNLSELNKEILNQYFSDNGIPALMEEKLFLKNDGHIKKVLEILSKFGKYARYYNLDVITGGKAPSSFNPKKEWEELERCIEDPLPYQTSDDEEAFSRDYYPKVNSKIIAIIERFIRAIARQFTLGGHGGKLKRYSPTFSSFINKTDSDLGNENYRLSVFNHQKRKENWTKRAEEDIINSHWPTRKILKNDFTDEWPFRADQVIIELRDNIFCIVNIEGYDFALNGSARSRYELPFPHDTGLAIFGKSIGPFIDMAWDLKKATPEEII